MGMPMDAEIQAHGSACILLVKTSSSVFYPDFFLVPKVYLQLGRLQASALSMQKIEHVLVDVSRNR